MCFGRFDWSIHRVKLSNASIIAKGSANILKRHVLSDPTTFYCRFQPSLNSLSRAYNILGDR